MDQRRRSRVSEFHATEADGTPAGSRRPRPLVTTSKPSQRKRQRSGTRAQESAKRSGAARHPVVLALNLFLSLFVIAVVTVVAALVIGRQLYMSPGPLQSDTGLVIDRGADVRAIAHGLEQRGIISNRYVFMAAALATGDSGRIKAGEYRIPARAPMSTVMDTIVSGRVVQHRMTFAEGLSTQQIVEQIRENGVLSGSIETVPPEGSLLPETYQFERGMERQRLLDIMQIEMTRLVEDVWSRRDPTLPLETPEDLVILASIVEKETGVAGERDRVAGVFVNRLRREMRLQSDPTILYGIYGGDAWSRPRTIYQSDLDRPNAYSTYQIDGLPPGPIANPGRAALEASANPAATTDLFFVADGTGGHAFAETYEEHQRNVARWREIEAQRDADEAIEP